MGQRVRVQLVFPCRKPITLFSSFRDFWRHHTNDEVFAFQQYFFAETGTSLTISTASDERWPDFVAFFLKLESFAEVARALFDLLDFEMVPFGYSTRHPKVLKEIDLLIEAEARLASFWSMWQQMRRSLTPAIWGIGSSDWEDGDNPRLNLDYIFFLEAVSTPSQVVPTAAHDVFVSYRHAKYHKDAHELANALRNRGLKVWLDTEQIGTRRTSFSMRQLRKTIVDGVRGSAIVAFFEGVAVRAIDPVTGESVEAFRWQQFERRHAHSLIYIYPSKHLFSASQSSAPRPYGSLQDLVEVVASARESARTGSALVPPSAEHPRLADVKRGIEEEIAELFGFGISISRRTTFLLAAPSDSVMAAASIEIGYGEHVLSHALTYGPRWAYLLARAGVDMSRDIGRLRWDAWSLWGSPSSRILHDTFDAEAGRGDATQLVHAAGRLTQDALLLALLDSAALGGRMAERFGRLFSHVLPAHRLGEIARLRDGVREALRDEPVPDDGQFWLLGHSTDSWRLRALAAATAARLEAPGLSGTFAVCQELRHGIFVRDRVDAITAAMNDADTDELRYALELVPDLRFLFGDTVVIRRAVIHELVTARGRPLGICLISETADAEALETTPEHDAQTILREAMALGGQLAAASEPAAASGAGFARFFQKREVILIGPAAFFPRLPDSFFVVSFATLFVDVIAKLLDYDAAFRDELDFR